MPQFNPDNYVDVQERITQFWSENPDGRIFTDLRSDPDNFTQVVFFAAVYKDKEQPEPDATGWAGEEQGQGGMANKTSWHENCETSAIGRAFANMGYATDRNDRPSRQEMQKVQRMSDDSRPAQTVNQSAGQPQQRERQPGDGITDRQIDFIRQIWREKGYSEPQLDAQLTKLYGHGDLTKLDRRAASSFIERLKALPGQGEAPAEMEPVVNQVTGEIIEDGDDIPF